MVVDTSAILAIIFDEVDAEIFAAKLASASTRCVSAGSLLETSVVLKRSTKSRDDRDLDNFLGAVSLTVVPFDRGQLAIARTAFQ